MRTAIERFARHVELELTTFAKEHNLREIEGDPIGDLTKALLANTRRLKSLAEDASEGNREALSRAIKEAVWVGAYAMLIHNRFTRWEREKVEARRKKLDKEEDLHSKKSMGRKRGMGLSGRGLEGCRKKAAP